MPPDKFHIQMIVSFSFKTEYLEKYVLITRVYDREIGSYIKFNVHHTVDEYWE